MPVSIVRKSKEGFTLIELMIVVSILGILAAIAIPRFANMIQKAREGKTKQNLTLLRGAVGTYYADNEGRYSPLASPVLGVLVPDYLKEIPEFDVKYHPKTRTVGGPLITDDGEWSYDGNGNVKIDCTHNDLKGVSFSAW